MRSFALISILLLATMPAAARGNCADLAGGLPVEPGAALPLDGDTLRLASGHCVRLWALDAPEFKTAAGPASRAALDELITGKTVTCQDLGDRSHGRVVARCSAGGKDLGEAMLRLGQAYTYRTYLDDPSWAQRYIAAENAAREERLGLWAIDGDGERAYAAWSAWLQHMTMPTFGVLLGYWQSLVGGFLAAFAATAAVWETRRAAKINVDSVKAQMANQDRQHAEAMAAAAQEYKMKSIEKLDRDWIVQTALLAELEACQTSIQKIAKSVDSWSDGRFGTENPLSELYVPRAFNPRETNLIDLYIPPEYETAVAFRDYRIAVAILLDPEQNKPIDDDPGIRKEKLKGYGMEWRRGALDRLEKATQAGILFKLALSTHAALTLKMRRDLHYSGPNRSNSPT